MKRTLSFLIWAALAAAIAFVGKYASSPRAARAYDPTDGFIQRDVKEKATEGEPGGR
jgi:hypothetical protein